MVLGHSLALGCGGRSYLGNLHFCTPYAITPRDSLFQLQQFIAAEDYTKVNHGILLSEDEIKIVKTKKFAVKPMDPEEACLQMELLGHSFYVFLNSESDQVCVVYRRKGGTYGLIEPEF